MREHYLLLYETENRARILVTANETTCCCCFCRCTKGSEATAKDEVGYGPQGPFTERKDVFQNNFICSIVKQTNLMQVLWHFEIIS